MALTTCKLVGRFYWSAGFAITLVFLVVPQTWAQDVSLDVRSIAGKSQHDVAEILGAPTSEDTTPPLSVENASKRYPQLTYRNGAVEIVFVDGKAEWITLNDMSNIPFSGRALSALGLPNRDPEIANQFVIRWSNIPGIKGLSLFPNYVLVIVRCRDQDRRDGFCL